LKSHLRGCHHEWLVRFVTVSRSRCVQTADRENALFHFFCLFKILDRHRYQYYRLQNSQGICIKQLLSAFGNDFNCGYFRLRASQLLLTCVNNLGAIHKCDRYAGKVAR